LDVEPDQRAERQEAERQQRPEHDPDRGARNDRLHGDLQRRLQSHMEHVVRDRPDPGCKRDRHASSGRANRASTRRITAENVQTITRYVTASTEYISTARNVSDSMEYAVFVSSGKPIVVISAV